MVITTEWIDDRPADLTRRRTYMQFARRAALAAALFALAALVVAGCGGSDTSGAGSSSTGASTQAAVQPGKGKPPVTIGTKDFTEEYILGELYARALRAAGYTVNLKRSIGPTEVVDKRSPPARPMHIPSTPARPSPPSPARTS
jgi:hypothetical protein